MIRFVGILSLRYFNLNFGEKLGLEFSKHGKIEDKRHVQVIFKIEYSVNYQPEASEQIKVKYS